VLGQVDTRSNTMIAPRGPWNVAWYPYSAVPGQAGNAVFSGHVDYIRIGPAVFWGLRGLSAGDTIAIEMSDGRVLTYRVDFSRAYGRNSGPWAELFSPAAGRDVITLYTCDGSFSGHDYDKRRVVRASRVR
jgi:sortase (surface protein transpeptidase)